MERPLFLKWTFGLFGKMEKDTETEIGPDFEIW